MRRRVRDGFVGVLIGVFLVLFLTPGGGSETYGPRVREATPVASFELPHCPEDAVLLGVGDFEDGTWDAYRCGPARDDYSGGTR